MEVIEWKRGGQKILMDGFMYTKKHVAKSSGWNNKFSSLMSHANPLVWKLTERIQAETTSIETVLLQKEHGPIKLSPGRWSGCRDEPRDPCKLSWPWANKVYMDLQVHLYNLIVDLNEGHKTMPEFLRGINHNLRGGQHRPILNSN